MAFVDFASDWTIVRDALTGLDDLIVERLPVIAGGSITGPSSEVAPAASYDIDHVYDAPMRGCGRATRRRASSGPTFWSRANEGLLAGKVA